MARSIKKGPYVDTKLLGRVEEMNKGREKKVIRTWARRSVVTHCSDAYTVAVPHGNKFIPIYISENMVGHKLGEFALTRTFRGHAKSDKTTSVK